jgi:aminoglycoside 6'-N-acetyltransferase
VHKRQGNACLDTDLEEILRAKNVTRLVIAGLVTHGCVRATCSGALELGYKVTLAKDGHSSYSKQAAILIDECNQKLSAKNATLKSCAEISFR